MPLWDLNDMIIGLTYKGRQEWERTRTAAYLCMAPHCKKLDIKKVLPFHWDKDTLAEDTYISNEDVDRMRKMSAYYESIINKDNSQNN